MQDDSRIAEWRVLPRKDQQVRHSAMSSLCVWVGTRIGSTEKPNIGRVSVGGKARGLCTAALKTYEKIGP